MEFDVIIVGGSFAGQAAALQLGRARRRVLLVDSATPRNRFAHTSHGFLTQDGSKPSAIISTAKSQLTIYSTVETISGRVENAAHTAGGFRVSMADGQAKTGKRLILATGVSDVLPDIEGIGERWGVSVLHCPYCHGYELNQGKIGVLATGDMSFHQGMLVPDWGATTLFTQGAMTLTDEQRTALKERGVTVEETPVTELLGTAPSLEAVRLADGRTVEITGLFTAPKTVQSSDLAAKLGCRIKEGFTGPLIEVNERQHTSVPGIFAAGDNSNPMANATIAAASGVLAGSAAHQTLVFGLG